jgi:acyl-CoA reductase-like NAD-dependent aldehyde dehydrogenase
MNKAGFATVNPSTGEEIEAFSYFTEAQTEKVVARADKSFQSFRELAVHKRAQLFTDLGNTLRKNKAQLAKVISTEMGKIFSEAEAEIEKCAHEADWYAEHGPKIMADEPAPTGTVCLLSAPWADPRDYAVEFSDLAAHSYGHPDDVGRQRCLGEALT